MSSDANGCEYAVVARNVGKLYQIYDRPQDRLKQSLWRGRRKFYKEFWALRDVSFSVPRGGALGIIGRNGSGKSTLLQIIAGTLMPSEGEVEIRGRVAALLELGSGFNPDFTGRENVFLNGAILGLSRAQMEERFDRIVAFADIGDFLDQPVKTYSSGMFVRLAFSVSANIDPEILIVDEALAVGDMQFQHRCIARIRELRKAGTTLIFVSHDPETVKTLCETGLWLEHGTQFMLDDARTVSQRYVESLFISNNARVLEQEQQSESETTSTNQVSQVVAAAAGTLDGGGAFEGVEVRILGQNLAQTDLVRQGEEFTIEVALIGRIAIDNVSVGFVIKDYLGVELTGESLFNSQRQGVSIVQGQRVCVRFTAMNNLRDGSYSVGVRINRVSQWDRSDNVLLYNDSTAAAFRVPPDVERPIWFRYRHPFEVSIT